MNDLKWRIELFGGFRVKRGEQVITHYESRKVAALFACLALKLHYPQPREVLAEQLWPDEEWEVVRNRLRQSLSSLRQTLEPGSRAENGVLQTDRAEAGLNPEVVTTDVLEFETALALATSHRNPADTIANLRTAVSLYTGELLPGFYEEWIQSDRERLAHAYRDALLKLANALAVSGDLVAAIDTGRRLVAADPLREDAHAGLMHCYAESGRASDAIRQYRELERILRDELGATPSPATRTILDELRNVSLAAQTSITTFTSTQPQSTGIDPEGGAVPLDSPYYVIRPTDAEFQDAIARKDSIVLVKGPRQIGKTSLLARGLQRARRTGAGVVLTDFQKLDSEQLESPATLFRTLAEMIVNQLDLDVPLDDEWNPRRGWNVNFERFLRRNVLGTEPRPLVWALDEVDRLFTCSYSNVVFGLFRSWHNERALDPDGPWRKLTLAIAYATEAHLFITDLNQSPFNVGTRLTLEDFTLGEVAELSRRYGSPFHNDAETARFYCLVGGHPYLVRRGLHAAMTEGVGFAESEAQTASENGIFGDHLRRMLVALTQDLALCDSVRAVLDGKPCPSADSFYRLRSAGVLAGEACSQARVRCGLYAAYLKRHLQ